jgi:hypothetical protein
MAVFDVTEYAYLATDAKGNIIPVGLEPEIATQQIAIGVGSAAIPNVFNPNTRFLRVHTDAPARFVVGAGTPTAADTNKRLGANGTEYFGVDPVLVAAGARLACITTT